MGGQYTRRWYTGNVRCGVEYWVMGDGQWGTPITMSWDANTAPQYWCQCWSNSDPQYWCQYWWAVLCNGSILYAMQRSCIQFNMDQDNRIQWYNNVTTLKVVQCLWNENNTKLFVVMPLGPNFWPFILEERERPLSPCRETSYSSSFLPPLSLSSRLSSLIAKRAAFLPQEPPLTAFVANSEKICIKRK